VDEHAANARPRADQEQESSTNNAEILILCHPRNVGHLVRAFQDEIAHAAGALPMGIVWSGVSGLLRQGVIVLAWEGPMNPAFLHNLRIDHEIFDFVVCDWNSSDEQQDARPDQNHTKPCEGKP